jgi:hypothetical protein
MKLFHTLSTILIVISAHSYLYSQSPAREAKKKFSDMVGAWQIREVINGNNQNVSKTSTHLEWILFTREGRFKSKMGAALDSGSYRMNEPNSILYLQSDTDNKTSQWHVSFSPGVMTLSAKDNPGADQFKYIYVRSKVNDPKALRQD